MRISVIAAAAVFAALIGPGAALAAPPANDAFASGDTIASLPASRTVDLTETTLEGGEPQGGCWQASRSAWYAITPARTTLVRITSTGAFDGVVNVYRDTGAGLAGLNLLGCGFPWGEVTTSLQGGATYYVQVTAPPWSGAGPVGLVVSSIDPPANDGFANAFSVGSLPYSGSVDARAATIEPGEPTQPAGVGASFAGTAWYSFTPSTSGSVMVSTSGCCAFQAAAVYTGSAVGGLTEVAVTRVCCGRLVFSATAGAEYRIQNGVGPGAGTIGISIEKTPSPSVDMWWSPFDPSLFDTTQFQANAWDPANVGLDSYGWDFGDGTGASGPNPTHRFASDGDYSVTLTARTPDGRSKSTTRLVSVRTRDVAITKLAAPQSGRVNQTKTITVSLANNRAAETVTVALYRGRASGGWDVVGQSTQLVPGKAGNRTTSFVFSYAFTRRTGPSGRSRSGLSRRSMQDVTPCRATTR